MHIITHEPKRTLDHDIRTFLWLRTNEPNLLVVFMAVRSVALRRAILTSTSVNASKEEIAEYLSL
jgi:hypothetical protein